jgi:hypothetical protein
MGYTHYWTQKRDFTKQHWANVCEDVGAILKDVQHIQNVPLASGIGEPGTQPVINANHIWFNGVGPDDDHETMYIDRVRPAMQRWETRKGGGFCKTARKPYDIAVTAVLAYLATVAGTHDVSTDGHGSDWLAGVEEAKLALPQFANILDIPMGVMQDDRWVSPWIQVRASGYEVRFCVDGHGYVRRLTTGESFCFETHADLALWLDATKKVRTFYGVPGEDNIWSPSGSSDKARWSRIAKFQKKALEPLFPVPAARAGQPPLYVRPGDMLAVPEALAYSFTELLNFANS